MVYRNQQGDDEYRALQPDSNIIFPPSIEIDPERNLNLLLDYKNNQVRYTNMIIDLNTLTVGNRVVLIRGFVDNEIDVGDVKKRMAVVRHMLENPSQMSQTNSAGGDDLFDLTSEAAASVELDIGNTKEINSMILPNGLVASPIPSEMIVEQLVFMTGKTVTSEVQCLDSKILTAETLNSDEQSQIENQGISAEDYTASFPKGGPKQSSWLDLRDDLSNIKRIVEIGILDVERAIESESGIDISIGG